MTTIQAPAPGTPSPYRSFEPYWWRPQYYGISGAPVQSVSPATVSVWPSRYAQRRPIIVTADLTPQTPEQAAATPVPAVVNPTPTEATAATTTSWFDQETISGIPNMYLAGGAALAVILFFMRKK